MIFRQPSLLSMLPTSSSPSFVTMILDWYPILAEYHCQCLSAACSQRHVFFVVVVAAATALLLSFYELFSRKLFCMFFFVFLRLSFLLSCLQASPLPPICLPFLFLWSHGFHYFTLCLCLPTAYYTFTTCYCHCYFSPISHLLLHLFAFAPFYIPVFGIMCLIPGYSIISMGLACFGAYLCLSL